MQPHCNKEGFNAASAAKNDAKARIGIVGNQQNDCSGSESRIGLGTGGYPDDSTNTCGNAAVAGADNGDKHINAISYILVQ